MIRDRLPDLCAVSFVFLEFKNEFCEVGKVKKIVSHSFDDIFEMSGFRANSQKKKLFVENFMGYQRALLRRRSDSNFGRGLLQDVCVQITQNKRVKDILDQAEKIRTMLGLLKDNVDIVKNLHNDGLLHTNPELGKDIPNFEELTLDAAREGAAHARIRVLQYVTSFEIFSGIMRDYHESLMKYHAECSSILHQQKKLIRKNQGSEYLESDPEEGEKTSLFVDNILEESRIARLQLSEMRMRHNELLKLEKSLVEIRDMFVELAFSVEKQGEQLNCVEHFAGQATDNVDNGKIDISKAEKRKNRNRKRKIKCFSILALVILILLIMAIFL